MNVEEQSLREELQLGREKYNALLETHQHLVSSKHQCEREIKESKNEVLALNEKMESKIKALLAQHERELTQQRIKHTQEMESAGQERLDSVKSLVGSHLAKLTVEKQVLQALQDTIVDRDNEIDRLKRQVDLANLEIGRLNVLVLTDAAHKGSPKVTYSSENISLLSPSSYSSHNRSLSNTPSKHAVEEARKVKDPEQGEASILLSSQTSCYGTNLFDSSFSVEEDSNSSPAHLSHERVINRIGSFTELHDYFNHSYMDSESSPNGSVIHHRLGSRSSNSSRTTNSSPSKTFSSPYSHKQPASQHPLQQSNSSTNLGSLSQLS